MATRTHRSFGSTITATGVPRADQLAAPRTQDLHDAGDRRAQLGVSKPRHRGERIGARTAHPRFGGRDLTARGAPRRVRRTARSRDRPRTPSTSSRRAAITACCAWSVLFALSTSAGDTPPLRASIAARAASALSCASCACSRLSAAPARREARLRAREGRFGRPAHLQRAGARLARAVRRRWMPRRRPTPPAPRAPTTRERR